MYYKKNFLIVFIVIFINGCTTMNSKFTCKTSDGVMCRSLDDVNNLVDRGALGRNYNKIDSSKNAVNFTPLPADVYSFRNKPLRYGESVMRIWTAPYEDTNGNYHDASVFYTVVKPGHWIGAPPQAIEIY